jgi:hypothetical protein
MMRRWVGVRIIFDAVQNILRYPSFSRLSLTIEVEQIAEEATVAIVIALQAIAVIMIEIYTIAVIVN